MMLPDSSAEYYSTMISIRRPVIRIDPYSVSRYRNRKAVLPIRFFQRSFMKF